MSCHRCAPRPPRGVCRLSSRFRRRWNPQFDSLELRALLAAVTWMNPNGGNWDVGANWSTGNVPGTGDTAVISTAGAATITVQSGDTIQVQSVTTGSNDTLSIAGGSLTVTAGSSTLSGPLTMVGGSLTATGSGTTLTANSTTTVSNASLFAAGGATLGLPTLASYVESPNAQPTLQASGSGSSLSLPALTTLSADTTTGNSRIIVNSLAGGHVGLGAVTTLTGPVQFTSDGTGSQIDLSKATSYQGFNIPFDKDSLLEVTNSGTLLDGALTSLSQVNVSLDGTGTIATSQWTTLTNGSVTVTGGTPVFTSLSNILNDNVAVSGGAQVALPAVSSYVESPAAQSTLQASGSGSSLSFPALMTLSADTTSGSARTVVSAGAGGHIGLGAVITLSGPVQFTSDGSGSEIDLPKVTSYQGFNTPFDKDSSIQVTNSGTFLDGALTSLPQVNVSLDGTGTIATSQWTTLSNAGVNVTGGTLAFTNLANILNDGFVISGGAQVALPAVTSYVESPNEQPTLQVSGSGSTLSFPSLTTLSADSTTGTSRIIVNALAGGHVGLGAVTTLSGPVQFTSDGAGSQIDLSATTTFQGFSVPFDKNSSIQVTNGGTLLDGALATLSAVNVTLDGSNAHVGDTWTTFTGGSLAITGGSDTLPALTVVNGPSVQVSGGGALSLPVLTAGNIPITNGTSVTIGGTLVSLPAAGTLGATINAPQSTSLTVTLQNSGTLTGTTVNVGQGTTVALAGGTYIGNTTLNASPGATVDLTGGQTTTFGGTLTGTATGTVALSGGQVNVGGAGLTVNFAGNTFQWTGGAISSSQGTLTTQGVINLTGSADKVFENDGVLDNFGTLIQTGSGNLGLHSDNVTATTLKNESGASYLLESDSGIDNSLGGTVAVQNAGTIRKTQGSGTSTLAINGVLSNTGAIEADSKTLSLAPNSITQVSGTTLNAGTWIALNGAALKFPNGTSVATNAANITLSGTGAAITALSGLSANSGSLTLGPGAALALASGFSQTSGGTLDIQISGTPASGMFGQLAVAQTASLAGTLGVVLASGFTPSPGQDYKVMTFGQASGNFTTFTGVSPSFTATLNAGSLDLVTPAPTGSVAALPAAVGTSFAVGWSGTDYTGGSGIASYTVFVSDDGAPFTAWMTNTTRTTVTFHGAYGHHYGFYSIATDNAGAVQPTPAAAHATTTVTTPLRVVSISPTSNFMTGAPADIVVTFNRSLAGLVPDKSNGTGLASSPFAVMVIPSGPDGQATQKATDVFWSAPSGIDAGDLPLPGTAVYHVNSNGNSTITLTPKQPLATDIYLISVNNVSDAFGDPLSTDIAGDPGTVFTSFEYRPLTSSSAPTVTRVTAESGSVVINNNQIPQPDTIGIRFSKPMSTYTINTSTVQLFQKGVVGALPAAVAYSPTTQSAYLTPETALTPGAIYFVSVSTDVTDDQKFSVPGTALANPYVTSFTVSGPGVGAGTSPLKVLSTVPPDGRVWNLPMGYGAVQFSEAINLSSLNRFSAMLISQTGSAERRAGQYADVPVNAKVAFNPNTDQLIIVPTGSLRNNTVYLFSLQGISATKAGDALSGTTFATFLLDTLSPAVVMTRTSVSAADIAVSEPTTVPVERPASFHRASVRKPDAATRPVRAITGATRTLPAGALAFLARRSPKRWYPLSAGRGRLRSVSLYATMSSAI